jgi:signal peptidase II
VVGVAAIVALVDWATKVLATVTLEDAPVELGSLITLRLSHNSGVAFGLGDRLPGPVLIVVTAAVTMVLAVAAIRGMFPSRVAAGLILGGAVANLADRVIGGTVVDFLDLGWWPSFNAADVALSVGCALLVLMSLRAEATEPV